MKISNTLFNQLLAKLDVYCTFGDYENGVKEYTNINTARGIRIIIQNDEIINVVEIRKGGKDVSI
jgi:hypothetical protein